MASGDQDYGSGVGRRLRAQPVPNANPKCRNYCEHPTGHVCSRACHWNTVGPSEPLEEATQYALNLATAIHAKHYPEVTQWEPLSTLIGLLTQIDNMTSGLGPPAVPQEPTGWQPLNTVPRDGMVELWHKNGFRVIEVWWIAEDNCWSCVMDDSDFTHWRPVPPPP